MSKTKRLPYQSQEAADQMAAQTNLIADLADLTRTAHTRIDALIAPQNAAPVDKSKEVSALVGLWIERQKAEGAMTVDLKRVDDVRAGIELALS